MMNYAEITLRTTEDGERLKEMTRSGWRVVTTATREGVKTYYLERVPATGPMEDKEHTQAWGHR